MRPARRHSLLLLSCLLLLFAAAQAVAQGSQMSADGSGSCPEASANAERLEEGDADPAAAANRRAQKAKPAGVSPRGGTRPAAPRWHSFLPGMFR